MKLYSENKDYKLYQGNMLDMLEMIESNTIDSIITDPPYELNFMGKGWDNSGIAFQSDTWKKCYEVLKPGGYLLAFGGSRTFHRIACAIEDAGFEIRDTIMWLYGSGFPKSMNIGNVYDKKMGNERVKIKKPVSYPDSNCWGVPNPTTVKNATSFKIDTNKVNAGAGYRWHTKGTSKWEGWGTCLKPSFEPIIIARKPFKGSLVDNVIEYGVGGLNIDECRVETNDKYSYPNGGGGSSFGIGKGIDGTRTKPTESNPLGRFPANTILTYDDTDFDEVCDGFPYTKGEIGRAGRKNGGNYNASSYKFGVVTDYGLKDSGSASRYFYCAKASKKDRDEGLEEFEDKSSAKMFRTANNTSNTISKGFERFDTKPSKNIHPTVKPTELMQYLIRLVTPNNGTILDPFNGSGSTGKAAMYENKEKNKGYKYIGIELTEEYLPIAKARIEYVSNLPQEDKQMTIFDL